MEETATRCLDRDALAAALRDSRARTLHLFAAYEAALGPELSVPYTAELNPPRWELGHIGWFADWWIARNPECHRGIEADPDITRRPARQATRSQDADAWYNSSRVAHATRWSLDLPNAGLTREDLAASLDDTLRCLAAAANNDRELYFYRLALFHEDMHAEAAVYMAQTLGIDPAELVPAHALPEGSIALLATQWTLGYRGPGFAFDNEQHGVTVNVAAFDIDRAPVSWARYLPFIDGGGYREPRFWSADGWQWRTASGCDAPRYWRRRNGRWEICRNGNWQAIDLTQPACHISAYEAEAWCAWAGRRLPTEAEWEVAAYGSADFCWGQVWEWTASAFSPFPGFQPHPYRDYSQLWFDGRPVLKGASHATAPRMRHRRYRNYFTADRNDIFAGFRSTAR